MMFRDFKAQLESQGCEFGNPGKNFIKVFRTTPDGTYSVRLGYPKANFEVDVRSVKRVRSTLRLDEAHGFDSGAFYEDSLEGVVDEFVNTYRQVLDRLAST